tara:strand:- start:4064 stop:5320 length:1257 start_codon:yes stop_codon:yes gene_type:complete
MARNPSKPGYGMPERRSLTDIAKEEAIRGGIRLGYGLLGAGVVEPVKTAMGAEGSIGRNFVADEVRAMKRQEAESKAAQRVAPYYTAQQQTQQRQMQEAGQTQRTGMTQQGLMDRQKLMEGSSILQKAMDLQSKRELIELKFEQKERLRKAAARAARRKPTIAGMTPQDQATLKYGINLMETAGKKDDKDMNMYNMGLATVLSVTARYPEFQKVVRQEGEGFAPSPTKVSEAELNVQAESEKGKSAATVAGIEAQGKLGVAQLETDADKAVQLLKNDGIVNEAALLAKSKEDVAKINAAARTTAAGIAAQADKYASDVELQIGGMNFESAQAKTNALNQVENVKAKSRIYSDALKALADAKSQEARRRIAQHVNRARVDLNEAVQAVGGVSPAPSDGQPFNPSASSGSMTIEEMEMAP